MAERGDSEKANGDLPAPPAGAASAPPPVSDDASGVAAGLPVAESPPLSPDADALAPAAVAAEPASTIPAVEPPSAADKPQVEIEAAPPPAWRALTQLRLTRRQRRNVLRAATVAFALLAGAGYGMILGGSFAAKEQPKPQHDTAAIAERRAMQDQIDKLSGQVAGLKSELDRASKTTQTKVAKIASRLDSVTAAASSPPLPAPPSAPAPEVTGSIPTAKGLADIPLPRPAPQIAAPLSRAVVVPGWHIREAIDGYVYVQWRNEIFEVVPGAPLPGLGRVRSIRREGGRWVVETPRGIIVSLRDRRYFE